jgi:phosphatidylserine/phosphatidylglycerophosphate/cardiolipin synthase-like enzyme
MSGGVTRGDSVSRAAGTRAAGTRVIFSPKGGASKELARLIKAAKKEVVVAVYAFSSKYLGQALAGALKRGVKIRVLLDSDNARKSYSIDEWLVGEGIEVRLIELERGSLHHKFILIDAKLLITGSYNYTNESEFRNCEAAIFTNHKGLIHAFATEFERLWLQGAPAVVSTTVVAASVASSSITPPAETSVSPAGGAEAAGPLQDTD